MSPVLYKKLNNDIQFPNIVPVCESDYTLARNSNS